MSNPSKQLEAAAAKLYPSVLFSVSRFEVIRQITPTDFVAELDFWFQCSGYDRIEVKNAKAGLIKEKVRVHFPESVPRHQSLRIALIGKVFAYLREKGLYKPPKASLWTSVKEMSLPGLLFLVAVVYGVPAVFTALCVAGVFTDVQ